MARTTRVTCRVCGKHKSEVGEISWAGYCIEHGVATRNTANLQMHLHRGPYFEHWRRAMAASVGAHLIDNTEGT